MILINNLRKLAFDLRVAQKLDFVPEKDSWFQSLKEDEQDII